MTNVLYTLKKLGILVLIKIEFMKSPTLHKYISLSVASLVGASCALALDDAPRPEKPNFLLILADDLGWQDIQVYDQMETDVVNGFGGTNVFRTPYMNLLAEEGVLFTNAYSPAPTCAPSRVAIMSGKHPGRSDVTDVLGGHCPKASADDAIGILPHYRSSLKNEEISLAEMLQAEGYYTGAFGKWHMSPDGHHSSFPQPTDQGFNVAYNGRGVQTVMGDRLTGFATSAPTDPYQLDDNDMATDPVTQEALSFLENAVQQEEAFFCYYATWLVHAPWQVRTERLLIDYAEQMGYDYYPLTGNEIFAEGQKNPYYAAMVESLDYYMNQLITYLKETDDPRWPGHKLIENTYVVLTSDNGGMENGDSSGQVTDNYPLDQGKKWIKEGGTRVPFIVRGPGIASNTVSNAVINGLDLYPTFLSLAGLSIPSERLDGCDLSDLWLNGPQDKQRILDTSGEVRESMFWHFPHSGRVASTMVKDGWKLYKNYDHLTNEAAAQEYSLYQLYDASGDPVDLGEMTDLFGSQTALANAMVPELEAWINEVDARPMYYNPKNGTLPLTDQSLTILSTGHDDTVAWVSWNTDRAELKYLDLLYTQSVIADRTEEWYKVVVPFTHAQGWAEVAIPEGAQRFFFTLVDENNFFLSSVDLTGHSGYDSELVPLFTWLPEGTASFTDVGTSFPTNDVLYSNSINGAEVAVSSDADSAAIQLIDDSFSTNTLTKDGNLYQDDTGWRASSSGAWAVETASGWVTNTSVNDGANSDGGLAQIVDLDGLGLTDENQLEVEFNFVSWDGANDSDDIYVHLWGLVGNSSTGTAWIANLAASNGNMWAKAVDAGFSVYNLGDGGLIASASDTNANSAAIQLLDQDSGTSSEGDAIHVLRKINLSSYEVDTLVGYDYFVIGFTRNPGADGNKFALYDVAVSATESSTSLVGQTFTVTDPVSLSALTLQSSTDHTVGNSDSADLYLWIGEYESGAPSANLFRTQVYEKVDMGAVSLVADKYYQIDFEDSVLLPGTYAFQLRWKELGIGNHADWARADGDGAYAGGDLIHLKTPEGSAVEFPFSQTESTGLDLVFALHGTTDHFGGWAAEHALDRIPEDPYLNGIGGSVTKNSVFYNKAEASTWAIFDGVLSNAGDLNNSNVEGAIAKCIDLTQLADSDAAELTLSFDYTTADAGETLFVHLWGCVDKNPDLNPEIMRLDAQNGNAWMLVAPDDMDVYNLGKPNGVFTTGNNGLNGYFADAAAVLTGSTGAQSYSATFDLSTFTTAPDAISDYDYLVLGFAREVIDTTNPSVSITNIRVSINGGESLHEFPAVQALLDSMDGDPDGDRRSNLFEFAFGGNPNDKNDVGLLPNMDTVVDGIDFVYQRRSNAATLGIRYFIETTADLTLPDSWEVVNLSVDAVDAVDDEFETVKHRLDTSGKEKEFIRLVVEEL